MVSNNVAIVFVLQAVLRPRVSLHLATRPLAVRNPGSTASMTSATGSVGSFC